MARLETLPVLAILSLRINILLSFTHHHHHHHQKKKPENKNKNDALWMDGWITL
jgi:hypothetical protein